MAEIEANEYNDFALSTKKTRRIGQNTQKCYGNKWWIMNHMWIDKMRFDNDELLSFVQPFL